MRDAIVTRPAGSIRARLHPWAILGVAAWQSVLALIGAYPAASLARAAYGNAPEGDAALWQPGGHALLDALVREAHGVSAALSEAALVLVAGAIAGLVPLAALLVAMGYSGEGRQALDGAEIAHAAARSLRPLALLFAAVTAIEVIAIVMAVVAYEVVDSLLYSSLGEAHAQIAGALFAAPALASVVVLVVVHDLSRTAVVAQRATAFRSWLAGAAAFRAAPLALTWSWAWREGASVPLIVAIAALAGRIGGRGGLALLVLGALHQSVIVARAALRASWLARALRLFGCEQPGGT
ncbi:MAG: hypothetical protein ACREJ3_13555 [Polyangiaceae bacterium]